MTKEHFIYYCSTIFYLKVCKYALVLLYLINKPSLYKNVIEKITV